MASAGPAAFAAPSTTAPSANPADKLTSAVEKTLTTHDSADFWVKLSAKANLDAAPDIADWGKRGQYVYDRLTSTAKTSQADVIQQLEANGVDYESFWISNRILVEDGTLELAKELAAQPEVSQIAETTKFDLVEPVKREKASANAPATVEWGLDFINAPEVWAQGFTGEGIVVSSVDTGVQFDHPALADGYRGRQPDGTIDNNYNFFDSSGRCGSSGNPCDVNGHGTHTMGTMMGDDGHGNQIGVAPDAQWIEANGCDTCSDADLLESGQWITAPTRTDGTAPDPTKRPHVVNNSWGYTAAGTITDWYQDITDAWAAAGIFGAWSAGNSGPGCQTTSSPGANTTNYSAGAVDSTGHIASFSSRGPGEGGGIKPNISAPGVNVRSSVPGGGYANYNGTSMAAPHLAGAVAVLWSAAPALIGDIPGTWELLNRTAHNVDDTSCGGTAENNNVYGEGTLDLAALIDAAPIGDMGTVAGTVTEADGDPISGARVTVDGEHDRTVTTGTDGTYSVRVAVGNYQVSASAFGYLPSAPTGATVTVDATTTVNINLEAAPRHTVSGTVTDIATGNPFVGTTVSISAPIDPVTTDANGTFAFTDVPEGTYTISVEGGSCTSEFSEEVVVDGDETVTAEIARRYDGFGYFCTVGSDGLATGDTRVNLTGDDAATTVPLPFSFPYYDGDFTTAYVSTNGHVNFAGLSTAYSNVAIPSSALPNAAIYPLWDDLYFDASAGLYTATTQVDGVDAFVLEWRNVTTYGNRNLRTNFSVTLLANGEIELGYGANSGGAAAGSSATVGIENENGTIAHQFSYNTPAINAGMSIHYDSAPRGTVAGTVTDRNTGAPISGATVAVSSEAQSKTVTTGADGKYSTSVITGGYSVKITAPNYKDATGSVMVTEDATTAFDAALAAGKVTIVSDGDTHANLPMGGSHTEKLTITNEGTAPASVDLEAGGGEFQPLATRALTAVKGKATVPASVAPKGKLSAGGSSMSPSNVKGETVTPQAAQTPADEITITHSASQAITAGNSASCNNGATTRNNSYLRTFTLADFGLNGLDVSSVSFGVETNRGNQPLTVNLYTLNGDLRYANMTLIGSADATVPAGTGTLVTVPVEGAVPSGGTLVVEVKVPADGFFFIGSNNAGQTAPSYIASVDCGISEPADTASIGFPGMHIVMNVTGSSGAPADWVSFDNPSFTLNPGESRTVTATMSADVDQPGAYSAVIGASTNTPYNVGEVPVSMNVTAPKSWGKVTGTVTSANGQPLGGAIVQVNGGKGYRKTLVTESDGTYAYWIDSTVSPLTLVVAAEGHAPATKKVTLKAGQTVRADFSLDPLR
ncbi:carboxypeptidase regulatory-like domain-containing protein [Micromonospora sp. DR5-3]|uniref:carboxypeptidase regulatory-like domain-containing protein n=1 Tax=unclassified Micromonospora TaxID=2617518 RepID=UPI0011D92920|nr:MULTISPECIES: carboxypeptidase regulatory-like domain-containing protein [unclassified Micromonospora]MCW3813469.1 carboxypeptidase regulatory-like domain-containing protein [Micromonospora sp. DR5-3]TYC24863.1 S8 family serine peptidase [Micromonospora sp. MP36]